MVHAAGVDHRACCGDRRGRNRAVDGGRRTADAGVDDGVRRRGHRHRHRHRHRRRRRLRPRRHRRRLSTSTRTRHRSSRRSRSSRKPVSTCPKREALKGVSSAVSSVASSAACRARRRRLPRRREPVRVGGNISPPTKVRDVPPVYPPVAQQARVQGVVILEAVIGPTGAVADVKVLRSGAAAGRSGDQRREAVAVHPDVVEWRAGAGHHDGDRQLHAAVVSSFERSGKTELLRAR